MGPSATAEFAVVLLQLLVVVPRRAAAQTWTKRTPRSISPPRDEELPAGGVLAVLADRLGFLRDVERVGRLGLHPVG